MFLAVAHRCAKCNCTCSFRKNNININIFVYSYTCVIEKDIILDLNILKLNLTLIVEKRKYICVPVLCINDAKVKPTD